MRNLAVVYLWLELDSCRLLATRRGSKAKVVLELIALVLAAVCSACLSALAMSLLCLSRPPIFFYCLLLLAFERSTDLLRSVVMLLCLFRCWFSSTAWSNFAADSLRYYVEVYILLDMLVVDCLFAGCLVIVRRGEREFDLDEVVSLSSLSLLVLAFNRASARVLPTDRLEFWSERVSLCLLSLSWR